jgi:hypothetical protein
VIIETQAKIAKLPTKIAQAHAALVRRSVKAARGYTLVRC